MSRYKSSSLTLKNGDIYYFSRDEKREIGREEIEYSTGLFGSEIRGNDSKACAILGFCTKMFEIPDVKTRRLISKITDELFPILKESFSMDLTQNSIHIFYEANIMDIDDEKIRNYFLNLDNSKVLKWKIGDNVENPSPILSKYIEHIQYAGDDLDEY